MLPHDPILLVEDEPDAVVLLRHAFAKAGIVNPVRIMHDGEQAVAYLSGEIPFADPAAHPRPALILLDLKIPRRSGLDVLRWIRSQPGLRLVPVIVMTSSKERTDVQRAYAGGANAYVVKPSSLDRLIEVAAALRDFWFVLNELPPVGE